MNDRQTVKVGTSSTRSTGEVRTVRTLELAHGAVMISASPPHFCLRAEHTGSLVLFGRILYRFYVHASVNAFGDDAKWAFLQADKTKCSLDDKVSYSTL